MDLVLIRPVDVSLNSMFLGPHCKYIEPTDGSGFNLVSERES